MPFKAGTLFLALFQFPFFFNFHFHPLISNPDWTSLFGSLLRSNLNLKIRNASCSVWHSSPSWRTRPRGHERFPAARTAESQVGSYFRPFSRPYLTIDLFLKTSDFRSVSFRNCLTFGHFLGCCWRTVSPQWCHWWFYWWPGRQFNQLFKHTFFVRKCFAQLFSNYSLDL